MNYMGRLWEEMQEVAADGKAWCEFIEGQCTKRDSEGSRRTKKMVGKANAEFNLSKSLKSTGKP